MDLGRWGECDSSLCPVQQSLYPSSLTCPPGFFRSAPGLQTPLPSQQLLLWARELLGSPHLNPGSARGGFLTFQVCSLCSLEPHGAYPLSRLTRLLIHPMRRAERQGRISSLRTGTVTVWPPRLVLQLCPGGEEAPRPGEMEQGSPSGASRAAHLAGEEEGAGGKQDIHVPEGPPGGAAS